jgi:glycosyltransferase involved in cell wall biosynthesis
MKILFFISVHGHGRGGHFHSLNHISRKIGERHDVKIISFGPGRSDIIKANPYFLYHINFNGLNFFPLKRIIQNENKSFKPDIYHCFDVESYNIIRLIISARKNKIVINKCGGPNQRYFPHVNNIILFSKENEEWFKTKNRFKHSNIQLVPNRVKSLNLDPEFYPIEKIPTEFVFMRICRIGHTYKKSIKDTTNLISKLLARGLMNIKLYIIGVVEDISYFAELVNSELVEKNIVVFLTESQFTNEASKMLYLADVVVGSGRGLMEAASLRKPVLAIDKYGEIPVLLDEIYFKDAFNTNFSERNYFGELNQEENLDRIIRLVQDKNYYSEISAFAFSCFENYFSVERVSDAYPTIYKKSKKGERKILADSILILKSVYNFCRNSLSF